MKTKTNMSKENGSNDGSIKKTGVSKKASTCYGKIEDLEEKVQPDWWRRIFNSLYLLTDGDVVNQSDITKKEVDIIIEVLNLKPEDRILDLCCGQGRHAIELAKRGFLHIEGLDRSRFLIQKAKTQAKKENVNIKFKEGDARKLPYPPDSFDIVLLMGNSFGYFENIEDDIKVLQEVFRVLKPWGRVLLDVANGNYLLENYTPRSWEWIDKKIFVCRERSVSKDKERLISREIIVNTDKGIIRDQFYAERLYDKEKISQLLKKAGFDSITFYTEIQGQSSRGIDLGMMEKRFLVGATAKKNWTPIKRRKEQIVRNVVVLLGDPTKPDLSKPGLKFDEDDFYTIDKLKDALRELKEFNFIYLNNHDTLVSDLLKLKEKMKVDYVFNLCDEGFYNDFRKESYIPVLLEILGIPYTGATPKAIDDSYDKSLVRGIAKELGIPVPEGIFIERDTVNFDFSFGFPLLVKPNFGHSSFRISARNVVNNVEELISVISDLRKSGYEDPILIEEFLTGADLTVGIIGNPPDYTVLPIGEEDYSVLPPEYVKICGYEAKWDPSSPYWKLRTIPAQLPPDTEKFIIESSLKIMTRMGCRDYVRIDWRLDSRGIPKLLDINPNPGWCWDGHMAKLSALAGISYSKMLYMILEAAEIRLGFKKPQE